jgi:IclR family transcriptional regulator, acetate operon repressor
VFLQDQARRGKAKRTTGVRISRSRAPNVRDLRHQVSLEALQPTLVTSSVQRALRLLEAVGERPSGATAMALAERTGLALPTTYSLLRTLVHEGYLRKLDDGAFVVGDRATGLQVAGRSYNLRTQVRDVMSGLLDQLNATVYLARYQDGELEVPEVLEGPRSTWVENRADFRYAAHATALGKCLLARLNPRQLADHFSRYPLEDFTPRTITRFRDLLANRPRRPAQDIEEFALGTACLAVPIIGESTPMALGVSFPPHKLDEIRTFEGPLTSAAGEISRAVALTGGFSDHP